MPPATSSRPQPRYATSERAGRQLDAVEPWTPQVRTYSAALRGVEASRAPLAPPPKRLASRSPEVGDRRGPPALAVASQQAVFFGHAQQTGSHSAFVALLHQGAQLQPDTERCAWQQAVLAFCSVVERADRALNQGLLTDLLGLPAGQQRAMLAETSLYISSRSTAVLRAEVLQALRDFERILGLQGVVEIGKALQPTRPLPGRRALLLALHAHVPRKYVPWFLRAAEPLLATGTRMDGSWVLAAAKACASPAKPRGRTEAERDACRRASQQARAPVQVPVTTDEDRRIILAAMQGAELDECATQPRGSALPGPIWQAQPENVQASRRIAAVKAAWAHLNRKYPRVICAEAMFLLADGAYYQLRQQASQGRGPFARNVCRSLEASLPHVPRDEPKPEAYLERMDMARRRAFFSGAEAVGNVWRGVGAERMLAIANMASFDPHLDEEDLDSRKFAGILWWIIHADRPSRLREAHLARQERSNLRYGFWRAIMDNNLVHVNKQGTVSLRRFCQNGLAQRLLSSLEGYETFRVNKTTPEQLLSILAEDFTAALAADAEPSQRQLMQFYSESCSTSSAGFSSEEREVFDVHLRAYMVLEWGEAARAAINLATEGLAYEASRTTAQTTGT